MRAGQAVIIWKVHLGMIRKLERINGPGKRNTIGILLIKYKNLNCMVLSAYLWSRDLHLFFKTLIKAFCLGSFSFVRFCVNSCFKECPHPDEKQRMELSRRLGLENKQIKFWFQNRRTHLKLCMHLEIEPFLVPAFLLKTKHRFQINIPLAKHHFWFQPCHSKSHQWCRL